MSYKLKNNEKFRRKHKVTCTLNDYEFSALVKYCEKYKIENKSKFIREALISNILEKFDEDYPTLFEPD